MKFCTRDSNKNKLSFTILIACKVAKWYKTLPCRRAFPNLSLLNFVHQNLLLKQKGRQGSRGKKKGRTAHTHKTLQIRMLRNKLSLFSQKGCYFDVRAPAVLEVFFEMLKVMWLYTA